MKRITLALLFCLGLGASPVLAQACQQGSTLAPPTALSAPTPATAKTFLDAYLIGLPGNGLNAGCVNSILTTTINLATAGTGSIIAGTTPTTGFTAGKLLYSDGTNVQAALATYDATLGLVVAGTQGYWTSGRGAMLQGADGVFTFRNAAGSSTFDLTAGAASLATFSGGIKATAYTVGSTAGADCAITGATAHLTVVKGIVTVCD